MRTQDTMNSNMNDIKDAVGQAKGILSSTFDSIKGRTKGAIDEVNAKACDFARSAEGSADDALTSMGDGVERVAETIKSAANCTGVLKGAVRGVASGLESSAEYFQRSGIRDVANDSTNVIKKHPYLSVAAAVVLGYSLARICSRE